jgi:hypothetical protein
MSATVTITLTLAQARGLSTAAGEGIEGGRGDPCVRTAYYGSEQGFNAACRAAQILSAAIAKAEGRS